MQCLVSHVVHGPGTYCRREGCVGLLPQEAELLDNELPGPLAVCTVTHPQQRLGWGAPWGIICMGKLDLLLWPGWFAFQVTDGSALHAAEFGRPGKGLEVCTVF